MVADEHKKRAWIQLVTCDTARYGATATEPGAPPQDLFCCYFAGSAVGSAVSDLVSGTAGMGAASGWATGSAAGASTVGVAGAICMDAPDGITTAGGAVTTSGAETASQPVTGNNGTSSNATMLMILMSGLTAGPAVSLYGSPTVSPVTAALWASEPFPPKWPSSMYFLALSQAPPPAVIEMATKMPVTITPSSIAPTAAKASARPAIAPITKNSTIGDSTGSSDGIIISLIAALVSMSTARP